MSGDSTHDYFAEGISEDIITDLSKVAGLFVIARNSSFAFKGRNASVKEIARKLGVRYVLEGSVRPTMERLRINCQLIDAITDGHVWADRFDGDKSNPFELEERVLRGVLGAITGAIVKSGVQALNQAAAWLMFVTSIPSLNFTPVITLTR